MQEKVAGCGRDYWQACSLGTTGGSLLPRPRFVFDNKEIAFDGMQGGRPQLYRMQNERGGPLTLPFFHRIRTTRRNVRFDNKP